MADFGLHEKDYFTLLHILCIASLILKTINAGAIVAFLDVQKAPKRDWSGLFNLAYNHRYFKHLAFQIIFNILYLFDLYYIYILNKSLFILYFGVIFIF
jgi:hypothetical protein